MLSTGSPHWPQCVTAPLVLALLATACATAPPPAPTPPTGENSFAVSGPKLGSQQFEVKQCYSGGRLSFLGVELTGDPPSLAVRLVVDPLRDQIVRVFDPKSRRSLLLTEANCKKFVADIDFGGSMVNGVREMKVTLDLDCKTPGGDFVVGRASNDHCL